MNIFFPVCVLISFQYRKEVNQIRNNLVCIVASLVFLFCCALTTDRCSAFQHKLKEIGVLRPVFLDYAISYDYGKI